MHPIRLSAAAPSDGGAVSASGVPPHAVTDWDRCVAHSAPRRSRPLPLPRHSSVDQYLNHMHGSSGATFKSLEAGAQPAVAD